MAPNAPSPVVPLVLVSTMVGMALLPWLRSYVSAVVAALQEIRGAVFLWPLLIILGISLISTVCQWMNPVQHRDAAPRNNRDWKGSSSAANTSEQPGDGSGVGLFMFLVFALVLIPWK